MNRAEKFHLGLKIALGLLIAISVICFLIDEFGLCLFAGAMAFAVNHLRQIFEQGAAAKKAEAAAIDAGKVRGEDPPIDFEETSKA